MMMIAWCKNAEFSASSRLNNNTRQMDERKGATHRKLEECMQGNGVSDQPAYACINFEEVLDRNEKRQLRSIDVMWRLNVALITLKNRV